MVKLTILRDLLAGDTAYAPGDVAAILPARAAELVAAGHAEWVDPPTPELSALEAEARAAWLVREGTPPGPRPAARRLPG